MLLKRTLLLRDFVLGRSSGLIRKENRRRYFELSRLPLLVILERMHILLKLLDLIARSPLFRLRTLHCLIELLNLFF